MQNAKPSILVFGASGAIGSALCARLEADGFSVIGVSRRASPNKGWLCWDVGGETVTAFAHLQPGSVSAVVWSQGMNLNDSIRAFDSASHAAMYAANVSYILESLSGLLATGALASDARLCVISSIWQNIARPNKLSYCVTKSALQGLVQSLAIDLGAEGKLVNAVLPGALDTPMTHANLSAQQIAKLESMSPSGSLPSLDDVCHLTSFLCSSHNTGITGQFISADRGFSYAKFI